MNITENARTSNTRTALRNLTRQAQALGADLAPEDVKISAEQTTVAVQLVPTAAVEAAGRAYYDRMERHERTRAKHTGEPLHWTPWEQLDRLHKASVKAEARAILEAAYPATRADQLRKFADELEAALETGDSPHQLPYDWRADADLLDGAR